MQSHFAPQWRHLWGKNCENSMLHWLLYMLHTLLYMLHTLLYMLHTLLYM